MTTITPEEIEIARDILRNATRHDKLPDDWKWLLIVAWSDLDSRLLAIEQRIEAP